MAAPELRLNVSLDLGFFRQQLQKLTVIAQSEFAPKLNVRFNRSTLDTELNNLQRAIKRRVYRVEIGGNIDNFPDKIESVRKQLAALETQNKIEIPISVKNGVTQKEARKARSSAYRSVMSEGGKILLPVGLKPVSQTVVDKFKTDLRQKLGSISVKVELGKKGGFASSPYGEAGLLEFMRTQGMIGKTVDDMQMSMKNGGDDIKKDLKEAVQSSQKIKSIFDGIAQSIATTGKTTANVQGKRLGLVNVPLIASSIERRVERSALAIQQTPSSDALKALYPEINKAISSLAVLKEQIERNASKLSGFSLIIGLAAFAGVPLAKSVVKLTGSANNFAQLLDKLGPELKAAFSKAAFNILSAASGRLLSGGSPAGLLPEAYRGIGPAAGPAGLLPAAYRGIGPSRNAGALPGTAFGSQKFLPTALGEELKEVLRSAANAFLDSIRQGIRTVTVNNLGPFGQKAITGAKVAGYLPPVARFGEGRTPSPYSTGRLGREGETQAELFARREREARMRSALRGVDVMGEGGFAGRPPSPYSYAYRGARPQGAIVPYAPGGAMVYSGPGGGGGMPPGGGAGGGPGNFARRGGGGGGGFNMPNLPSGGLVREIGQEFAFATKQVLLFGTAYKALAFATSFPAQVGQAVAALQSFNNTLKAVSPNAKEVEASNGLILELVDKYNIPLQSARDGFTKLYASMQSAGFAGDEVRNIFTGISKAAATFGMSADKVDRVNYAFAQMASKGQVMSEELKGQLGDVLPGALGIFAEAAGFKGPNAIQKFSKALEDGAYKGQAMKQLLTNVGIVMNKEFGPGAEGAARTFQGAMNRMQNSLLFLYEAFEPAAVSFLNAVVMPLTNGIKQVTDGFNAFFTGQAAKTAGGSALAQQLNELKPSFEGILNNLRQLTPTFQLLGNILLGIAKAFAVIAGNPITGFLLKLYANVLLVNGVFTLLGGRILVTLIGNISAAIARFVALNVAVATMQRTATVTNSTLAGTQLQMALLQRSAGMATGPVILLRNALLSIARIGLIAIGINVVINGLAELDRLKQSLAEIGTFSSAKYRKEISGMSKEDINSRLIENRRTQEAIQKELGGYAGPVGSAKGLVTGRDEELRARLLMVQTKEQALIRANKTAKAGVSLQSQVTGELGAIGGGAAGAGGAAGGGTKLDTYDRSKLDFIQQQAEQEQLALDRRRQQNVISETRYKIDSAALALDTAKLEEAEKLRLATMATNKDNLSAQDKQLKLADLQIVYTNNLAIAQDKYNVAVEGAKKELEGPFNDAIDNANFSIMEQQMLLENIQNGVKELTPDQQAYLEVLRLTTGKSEDELKILAGKSNALRQILEQQIAINKQVEVEQKLRALRDEIKFLRIIGDEERRIAELREEYGDEKAQEIFNLEKIKKNIEDTRALIGDFVSSTTNDYKGFLKAVISGEDAADALRQFQEGLKDRVLTIFFDFAMAPVEKFMKEAFEGLFDLDKASAKEKAPELPKADSKNPVDATNGNTDATRENTQALKDNTAAKSGGGVGGGEQQSSLNTAMQSIGGVAFDASIGVGAMAGFDAESVFGGSGNLTGGIFDTIAQQMNGATESFSSFSDHMGQFVDSSIANSESLGQWTSEGLKNANNETNTQGATFKESLGKAVGAIGIAAGSIMGIAAGISQIKEGGTANVLGGIGSVLMGIGGGISGFGSLFKLPGFADGGMVTGPTVGLIGEGKYNEAIVPLPDGRSIPVQFNQQSSLREAMAGSNNNTYAPSVLSMTFESTSINGIEYVSRDQLEQAMAQTRRQASRDGAQRGMTMTLDKLQQSPSTRSRLGMR